MQLQQKAVVATLKISTPYLTTKSEFVGEQLAESERPDLTQRKLLFPVVAVCRTAKTSMLEDIADKLGAAVGASRAAVDAGFVPTTCRWVKPVKLLRLNMLLLVLVVLSSISGMKDSKVIVAINKDEEAPIFQVADYGLLADLFDVLLNSKDINCF